MRFNALPHAFRLFLSPVSSHCFLSATLRSVAHRSFERAKLFDDPLRVCSKSPMLWSVSVVACTETDPGTSPRSADGASTESC